MRYMRGRFRRTLLQLPALIIYFMTTSVVAQVSGENTLDAPTATLHEGSGGSIGNRQIRADWEIHNGHLDSVFIRNISVLPSAENATLLLGNPFSISLKEFGVLRAEDLEIQREPRVEQLNPNAGAARYSDRLPGVAVHYELADRAGRFHADWALVLRQGSSYIRQILTVTANDKTVPIDDVGMIDLRDQYC